MLKVTIFTISFFIGCEAFFMFSEDRNVVEQFPLGDSGIVLEVQKEHAHLFLAEYDFKLILKKGSKEMDSTVLAVPGGRSRIDVLKVRAGQYAFRHYGRSVCLDIAKERFDGCYDSQQQGIRIGYFDFDSARQWKYILL